MSEIILSEIISVTTLISDQWRLVFFELRKGRPTWTKITFISCPFGVSLDKIYDRLMIRWSQPNTCHVPVIQLQEDELARVEVSTTQREFCLRETDAWRKYRHEQDTRQCSWNREVRVEYTEGGIGYIFFSQSNRQCTMKSCSKKNRYQNCLPQQLRFRAQGFHGSTPGRQWVM